MRWDVIIKTINGSCIFGAVDEKDVPGLLEMQLPEDVGLEVRYILLEPVKEEEH